jgi:hypothetical protein
VTPSDDAIPAAVTDEPRDELAVRRVVRPGLSAAGLDRLAADTIATDLRSITAAALDAALHAMFGLPVGGIVVTKVRGEERVRVMLPTLELDAAAVGRLAAFVAALKAGEVKPLSAHAERVLAALDDGWLPVAPLARRAGLDTADTRRALAELKRAGLAMHAGDDWRRK